ncbi:hypothetical protein TWF281_010556 [Arthrobotrys megalospora]
MAQQDTRFPHFPTGIVQLILSCLCRKDQISFAICSKQSYLSAAPTIFECVKIHDQKTVQLFEDGARLGSMRKYVRSVKLWATYKYKSVVSILQAVAVFPNISGLEIRIEAPGRRELDRNIYAAVFSLLSTLPYYEGLKHLAFVSSRKASSYRALCGDTELLSDVETDYEGGDGIYANRIEGNPEVALANLRGEMEKTRRENYTRLRAKLSLEDQNFVGDFLSSDEFTKLVLAKLQFPEGLESLKVWSTDYAHIFGFPLVNCGSLTKLSLNQAKYPIMDFRQLVPGILQLTQVKILRLDFDRNPHARYLAHLPTQYPNLEVLEIWTNAINNCSDCYDQDILNYLPNFPKLIEMMVPWPRVPDPGIAGKGNTVKKGIYRMEAALRERIEKGDFGALKKIKLFGVETIGGVPDEASVHVDRLISTDGDSQNGYWVFQWEYDREDCYDARGSGSEDSPRALCLTDEEEEEDRLKIRRGILAGTYWYDEQLAYYETLEVLSSRRPVGSNNPSIQGKLLQLPTEIIHLILENMFDYQRTPFAKCSRRCYFLTFPDRIRGVMFNRHGRCNGRDMARSDRNFRNLRLPLDGPGSNSVHIQRFDEGRCFAPLRPYIETASFYALDASDVAVGLPLISQFSNVTSIKIWIKYSRAIERQLYAAVLVCLPTLSCYNNLKRVSFEWWGLDKRSDSEPDGYVANESNTSPEVCEEKQRTNFEWKLERMNSQEKQFFSFGGFISKNALPKLILDGGLRFPTSLQYLKLDITEYELSFCLALAHCKALVALHITGGTLGPIVDPETPDTFLEFPNMKALALYSPDGYDDKSLSHLAKQFPNLKQLFIPTPNEVRNTAWISSVPNMMRLDYLELPWPGSPDSFEAVPRSKLERDLALRLGAGHFPALRIAKVSQKYNDSMNPGYRNGFAIISRVGSASGGSGDRTWSVKWEVNSITNRSEDRAKRLDEMWKSGYFLDTSA